MIAWAYEQFACEVTRSPTWLGCSPMNGYCRDKSYRESVCLSFGLTTKHDKAMWQWIYPLFALCNFSCTSLLSVWGALVVDTRNIIISQPYWTSICFILYARISVNLLLNFVYFRLARGCGFYLYRVELDPHVGYMDSYTNKLRLRCMFCLSADYKLHHGTRLEYWFLTLD